MTFYITYLFHLELLKAHSLLTMLKAIQVDRNYIFADACEYLCLLNKEISQECTEEESHRRQTCFECIILNRYLLILKMEANELFPFPIGGGHMYEGQRTAFRSRLSFNHVCSGDLTQIIKQTWRPVPSPIEPSHFPFQRKVICILLWDSLQILHLGIFYWNSNQWELKTPNIQRHFTCRSLSRVSGSGRFDSSLEQIDSQWLNCICQELCKAHGIHSLYLYSLFPYLLC